MEEDIQNYSTTVMFEVSWDTLYKILISTTSFQDLRNSDDQNMV